MKPYFETDRGRLYHGDCLEVMRTFPADSLDSLVTDPPYGLSFMGKKWDYDVPGVDVWRECLRVLKPGAIALIFAGSRTQHRMAVNVEDAGFILKDCIMWLYGSGFPKALDVGKAIDKAAGKDREVVGYKTTPDGRVMAMESKAMQRIRHSKIKKHGLYGVDDRNMEEAGRLTAPATPEAQLWDGWRTSLKPAYEPILVAEKPVDGTYARNALKHGVAGFNIDGCRVGNEIIKTQGGDKFPGNYGDFKTCVESTHKGRYPANVILDEEAAQTLDEQSGVLAPSTSRKPTIAGKRLGYAEKGKERKGFIHSGGIADQGGASRFFYTAKASPSERDGSEHPTMKPLKLMEYLCNLTKTPTGGTVLDPFAGSGTTGLACHSVGREWVLIERELEYCEIAVKRIDAAASQKTFEDYL
jgi:site-specific DNA-methyltransferase (adenine-specific)